MSKHVCGVHPGDYGAGDRSRTYDLLITNELLYQLSYTGEDAHSKDLLAQAQDHCYRLSKTTALLGSAVYYHCGEHTQRLATMLRRF